MRLLFLICLITSCQTTGLILGGAGRGLANANKNDTSIVCKNLGYGSYSCQYEGQIHQCRQDGYNLRCN